MAFLLDQNAAPVITPEMIKRRRALADAMTQQGMSTEPVQHWTQGAARLAQALVGGMANRRADEQEREGREGASRAVLAALTGGDAAPSIAPASTAAPLPPSTGDYFSSIRRAESGGNDAARNPNSTATGRYQFLEGTWNDLAKRHPNLGLTPDGRLDPNQQERAMRVFTDENSAVLKRRGFEATPGNLYAAHFLGSGDAPRVLGAADDVPVSSILDQRVIAANPHLANMTAGQFKAWASRQGGGQPQERVYSANEFNPIDAALVQREQGGQPPATSAMAQGDQTQQSRANIARLMQTMNSPWMSPAQQQVVGAMLQAEYQKLLPRDPTWGVIGEDEYNRKRYGWIDPRRRSAEAVDIPQVTAQTGAAPGSPPGLVIPPPPQGADPKKWREQYTTTAAQNSAQGTLPPASDDVMKLRKEVGDLPSYKNLAQSAPVYKSMLEAAGRDNRAADVNLIYGMAKLMDPGSVVRESEMSVAQAIATLPQALRANIESQLTATGRLSPEVRQALMQEAYSRLNAYRTMFDQDAGMYRGIAERGRMNVEDVIPNFGTFDEYKPPAPPAPVSPGSVVRQQGAEPAAPAGVDPKVWKHMTPQERALWK